MLFVIIDEYRVETLWVEDLKEKLLFLLLCLLFSLFMLSMSVIINLAIADDTKQKENHKRLFNAGNNFFVEKRCCEKARTKKEKAIRKEERARAVSIEESD